MKTPLRSDIGIDQLSDDSYSLMIMDSEGKHILTAYGNTVEEVQIIAQETIELINNSNQSK